VLERASAPTESVSGTHAIRVVVVDDEALVRSGFSLILGTAADIELVSTATGGDAVAAVREHRPDVVLLDIRMPDVDGLTVLQQLLALPAPPVVAMLTTFDTDEYVLAALNIGAAGFLLKDTDPDQLAQLVRTLAAGGVVMSPKTSRTLLRAYPGTEPAVVDEEAARVELLTARERDVLVLLAEGLSNVEIGTRLYRGPGPSRITSAPSSASCGWPAACRRLCWPNGPGCSTQTRSGPRLSGDRVDRVETSSTTHPRAVGRCSGRRTGSVRDVAQLRGRHQDRPGPCPGRRRRPRVAPTLSSGRLPVHPACHFEPGDPRPSDRSALHPG
jgi:DNA-binding NarL/FixJ family response regulator